MIALKDFLIEKGFHLDRMENIIDCFCDGDSISNISKKITSSDIPLETLVIALQEYSELCKVHLLSNFLEIKENATDILEMIEILGGILLGLHLMIERKKPNPLPNIFFFQ